MSLSFCVSRHLPTQSCSSMRNTCCSVNRACSRILNVLSDKIPRNLFVDFSHELIDRDYVFQNCLEGELWDDIKNGLSDEENEELWAQLGWIVKEIHSIPHRHFGPPAPMHPFDLWSDAVISWITDMLNDMQRFQLPCKDAVNFLQIVKAGRRHLDAITQPRLVHGDLWQRNILVGRNNGNIEITAVLDAERAFWGDPAAEWIFSFLDIPARFWQAYGELDSDRSAIFRRRVYEGRGAIQLCLEAWRFHFDDSPFRRILQRVTEEFASCATWVSKPIASLYDSQSA